MKRIFADTRSAVFPSQSRKPFQSGKGASMHRGATLLVAVAGGISKVYVTV